MCSSLWHLQLVYCIGSKHLDVELVALHIDSTNNELLSVSEKLGFGAFILTRLSQHSTCDPLL